MYGSLIMSIYTFLFVYIIAVVYDNSNICRNVVVLPVQQKQAVYSVYSHAFLNNLFYNANYEWVWLIIK